MKTNQEIGDKFHQTCVRTKTLPVRKEENSYKKQKVGQ